MTISTAEATTQSATQGATQGSRGLARVTEPPPSGYDWFLGAVRDQVMTRVRTTYLKHGPLIRERGSNLVHHVASITTGDGGVVDEELRAAGVKSVIYEGVAKNWWDLPDDQICPTVRWGWHMIAGPDSDPGVTLLEHARRWADAPNLAAWMRDDYLTGHLRELVLHVLEHNPQSLAGKTGTLGDAHGAGQLVGLALISASKNFGPGVEEGVAALEHLPAYDVVEFLLLQRRLGGVPFGDPVEAAGTALAVLG